MIQNHSDQSHQVILSYELNEFEKYLTLFWFSPALKFVYSKLDMTLNRMYFSFIYEIVLLNQIVPVSAGYYLKSIQLNPS